MRIVVSGTHASGKSTLIADFARRHPHFDVLSDPFELMDDIGGPVGAGLFASQLRIAADRLLSESLDEHVIAERGPVDFLAYLLALEELGAESLDAELWRRAVARTAASLKTVDLLVVLPLTATDDISVGADEHLELRAAMNDALLDLIDDRDIVGAPTTVAAITGDPDARLAALEALVRPSST